MKTTNWDIIFTDVKIIRRRDGEVILTYLNEFEDPETKREFVERTRKEYPTKRFFYAFE